jgi:hypothetical protein
MATKKKATRRTKKMDDTNEVTQADPNATETAADDSVTDENSVEDRLAAIEHALVEIRDLLSGDKTVEREREAHAVRHTKVPYVPPELPAGLSPNQILQAPQVNNPGLRAEADAADNNEVDDEQEEEVLQQENR